MCAYVYKHMYVCLCMLVCTSIFIAMSISFGAFRRLVCLSVSIPDRSGLAQYGLVHGPKLLPTLVWAGLPYSRYNFLSNTPQSPVLFNMRISRQKLYERR